jgi:hypothetical protein
MPNRNFRPRQSRSRNKGTSETNNLLKRLVLINEQQSNKDVPTAVDVPRLRIKRQKIYTFSQSQDLASLGFSSTAPVSYAFAFSLSMLGNSSSFTSLFDQYRIMQVNCEFFPEIAQSSVSTSTYPPIYSVIDYDDNSLITIAQALQYDTLQVCTAGTYFQRTFVPKASMNVYSGITAGSYASTPTSLWMDIASPGVSYFGLKVCVDVASAASTFARVNAHYIIQFRNTR